jgi:hypothetical protein
MRWTYCAALSLAATSLLIAAQDTHKVAWNPAKGAKTKFQVEMASQLDIGQGPMALLATLVIENEIKDVSDEKITILSATTSHNLTLDQQDVTEMWPGQDGISVPINRTFDKHGVLLTSDSKSPLDNPRFEQLRVLPFPEGPVKVGDTWTREYKGDKEKGVPPSRGKFTLDGVEDLDGKAAFRIKFAYSELEGEKPMGALGTSWIDQTTGEMIKTDSDINDAQFAEEMPPMNFKMKVRRL